MTPTKKTPTTWPDYELLDFGGGRKLERFGAWLLDRPCPAAAASEPAEPLAWPQATARYAARRAAAGNWLPSVGDWAESSYLLPAPDDLRFTVKLTPLPSGQVGVFPEQRSNWGWIAEQVQRARRPLQVLNLFAYTGGSTLAAARAGAAVTHVDASSSMVQRARQNAQLSGLADCPIRWIVEDAIKFCQREVRRGRQYDAVILDPPSYGHGPQGQAWSIQRDLLPLLKLCSQLTTTQRTFMLCTCHTPDIGPAELSAYLSEGLFGHCSQPPRCGQLVLPTTSGQKRKLPSGTYARWPK